MLLQVVVPVPLQVVAPLQKPLHVVVPVGWRPGLMVGRRVHPSLPLPQCPDMLQCNTLTVALALAGCRH